jgi:hypothetical protein
VSRLVPLSAVALSAVLLSACGTGLQAKTYSEVGRQDGARVDVGDLSVRNLHVTPPLSGSAIPTGLTRDLAAGTYVSVTLTFQKAARVTLQVPVRAGDNGLADRQAEQDPYGAE